MFPASSKQAGMCFGAPDVCMTPAAPSPVPIPYPNTGSLSTASGTVSKVVIANMEAAVESTTIPQSHGDEMGTLGGVVSGVNMGQIAFKTYSMKCYAGGKKMVYVTCMTGQNGSPANVPGAQVMPSQMAVLIS
jgi:Domain of unknown function (DUF4150)